MKYFEQQGERDTVIVLTIIIMLLMLLFATHYQIERVGNLEHELSTEQGAVEILADMVARDDVLLDKMLDEPWNRDLPVYARWYLISNGSKVWAFTQYPDPDVIYQLSY